MFPGGQKHERESAKDCLRREIKEELPKLKLGRIKLWKKVNGTNRHSGRQRRATSGTCSSPSDSAAGKKRKMYPRHKFSMS
jgi:hypothetical protein